MGQTTVARIKLKRIRKSERQAALPQRGLQQAEDLRLLSDVLNHVPAAWDRFFARYERLIAGCVRRVFKQNGLTPRSDDVEDLISGACLELIRNDYHKLRLYDSTRNYQLSSWIGLITMNSVRDALRKRDPLARVTTHPDDLSEELIDCRPTPHERLVRQEQLALLQGAFDKLSPGAQRMLRYLYEQQMEPTAIARLLGINVATVYSRKAKAHARLRQLTRTYG